MSKVTSITRDDAVALFIALGFKTAAKWSNDRIQTKLTQVHTKVDASEELEDEAAQETLNTVLETSEAGNDFEVEGEAPAATAAKKKTAKKPAKKAAKKPAKKAAKKPAGKKKEATGDGRPKSGTSTGKVWDVCDKLQKKYTKKKKTVPRKEVVAACVEEGVNKSTAGVQFGKWCAANGLDPKNS